MSRFPTLVIVASLVLGTALAGSTTATAVQTGAGATAQEAAEVIGVAIMMNGGPATIHGARAYTAFCEFANPAGESV